MPYIKSDEYVRAAHHPATPGELNYAITLQIIYFLQQRGDEVMLYAEVWMICRDYLIRKGLNYTFYNDVMGALECAEREMFRRTSHRYLHPARTACGMLNKVAGTVYDQMLAPYEDEKIKENGDVYPESLTKEE